MTDSAVSARKTEYSAEGADPCLISDQLKILSAFSFFILDVSLRILYCNFSPLRYNELIFNNL